jgi:pRiA4b ORF-3-like protein
MPKRQPRASKEVYQLKVTLRDVRPPIWRRVLVTDATNLNQLHWIIQIAMGWTNSHLHQFIIDEEYYSEPMLELDDWGPEVKNEKRVRLSALSLEPKRKFTYEYDFGDSWQHEILVEKVLAPEAGARYPQCIGGKRACPPEDCGGVWGYERFLEVIKDEDDPEHEETLEWAGGSFDPEAFSVEEANEALQEEFR